MISVLPQLVLYPGEREGGVMDRLAALCAELRAALLELEPGTYDADRAATLAEELATTENACAMATIRMAARAAQCGAHRERGFADASDWIASTSGTTLHEARRQIDAVAAIELQCPETREALVEGSVSLAQAAEIVRTEGEVPGCEHELVALAKTGTLGAIREHARARRVEAIDREELYARQRKAREFSHWRDDLGMVRGSFALTPEVGVALVNRIDAETDRLRRDAAKRGRPEPRAAIAADALARLFDGTATTKAGMPVLNVVIDWPALVRGHLHSGERSHIVGGGPIPPRVAAEILPNSFVKAVLTDGVEVQRVKHFGRRMRAELRTALELGPPPDFDGVTCTENGCERRYGLEWDHVDPVAHGGATSYENLKAKCEPHHWDKTERDRRSGLLGKAAPKGRTPGRPP